MERKNYFGSGMNACSAGSCRKNAKEAKSIDRTPWHDTDPPPPKKKEGGGGGGGGGLVSREGRPQDMGMGSRRIALIREKWRGGLQAAYRRWRRSP